MFKLFEYANESIPLFDIINHNVPFPTFINKWSWIRLCVKCINASCDKLNSLGTQLHQLPRSLAFSFCLWSNMKLLLCIAHVAAAVELNRFRTATWTKHTTRIKAKSRLINEINIYVCIYINIRVYTDALKHTHVMFKFRYVYLQVPRTSRALGPLIISSVS